MKPKMFRWLPFACGLLAMRDHPRRGRAFAAPERTDPVSHRQYRRRSNEPEPSAANNFLPVIRRKTGTTGLESFLPPALLLPGWFKLGSRGGIRWLVFLLAGMASGCHSMGPTTISQDRVNYSDAIAE